MIIVLYLSFTFPLAIRYHNRYQSFCDPILYLSFLGFQLWLSLNPSLQLVVAQYLYLIRKAQSKFFTSLDILDHIRVSRVLRKCYELILRVCRHTQFPYQYIFSLPLHSRTIAAHFKFGLCLKCEPSIWENDYFSNYLKQSNGKWENSNNIFF